MNFVQFARCRPAEEVPTVELGEPWVPSGKDVRETLIPMMDRPDALVFSFTNVAHIHLAELKRDGIILTVDEHEERQYVPLSHIMSDD